MLSHDGVVPVSDDLYVIRTALIVYGGELRIASRKRKQDNTCREKRRERARSIFGGGGG